MILDRPRHRGIWIMLLAVLLMAPAGCRNAGGRSRVTRAEPSLSGNISDDVIIGDASVGGAVAPARTVSAVDRHPLFSKPREYWDSSGDNKLVKAAAATFIGVPAGVVGEVKQIVVGVPPEPKF